MTDPWFKFFPSDWLGGTGGMTAAERGVYITLVAMIYDAGGPIRHDDARLARRCGVTKASWLKIIRLLIEDGKITALENGLLSNPRCEIELSARANRVQNATIASEKAAASRAGKIEEKQRSDPPADDPTDTGGPPKPEARSQIYGDGGSAREAECDLTVRERLLWAAGIDPQTIIDRGPGAKGGELDMAEADRWIALFKGDVDSVVRHVASIRSGMSDPPNTLRYFTKPLQKIAGAKSAPALKPIEGTRHDQQSARDRRSAAADDAFVRVINAAAGSGRSS